MWFSVAGEGVLSLSPGPLPPRIYSGAPKGTFITVVTAEFIELVQPKYVGQTNHRLLKSQEDHPTSHGTNGGVGSSKESPSLENSPQRQDTVDTSQGRLLGDIFNNGSENNLKPKNNITHSASLDLMHPGRKLLTHKSSHPRSPSFNHKSSINVSNIFQTQGRPLDISLFTPDAITSIDHSKTRVLHMPSADQLTKIQEDFTDRFRRTSVLQDEFRKLSTSTTSHDKQNVPKRKDVIQPQPGNDASVSKTPQSLRFRRQSSQVPTKDFSHTSANIDLTKPRFYLLKSNSTDYDHFSIDEISGNIFTSRYDDKCDCY